jgi:Flp pilus assembly pilin Flp
VVGLITHGWTTAAERCTDHACRRRGIDNDSGCPHDGVQVAEEVHMAELIRRMWSEDEGQDIAEYAVMLAVILVIVVGTIRLIGTQSNTAFSNVASSIQ